MRFFSRLMLIVLLVCVPVGATGNTSITVQIDGYQVMSDQPPVIEQNQLFLPLRGIVESAGGDVGWNSQTRTVSAVYGEQSLSLQIDQSLATWNGMTKSVEPSVQLINGRTLVPADLIEAAFSFNVEWNAEKQLVTIYTSLETTLFAAAEANDVEKIKVLLSRGANPDAENQQGWTPLMTAIFFQNTDSVRAFIESGASVNIRTEEGFTPLTWAARYGNTSIVNLLIEAGADPNVVNHLKWTPLMYTAYTGNTEMAKVLIEAGADVNFTNEFGESALSVASQKHEQKMVTLLETALNE
ncbi:MAG: ankyrin repeat domain-containing protein [Bacillaceae bacterium]|nr:ankyrin repeat domain-containing protein [Bacillaceae bacterium]